MQCARNNVNVNSKLKSAAHFTVATLHLVSDVLSFLLLAESVHVETPHRATEFQLGRVVHLFVVALPSTLALTLSLDSNACGLLWDFRCCASKRGCCGVRPTAPESLLLLPYPS